MTIPAASATAALDELDGLRLAQALRASIYRLFEQTDHINKINVFPVPDGDTGTNLSMTLCAVLAALDDARDNCGAILAQFLLGLADKAGPQPTLIAAVREAILRTRRSPCWAAPTTRRKAPRAPRPGAT